MFVPDGRESNPRQQRGLEIANKAEQIEQVNDKTYRVHSQGGVEWYLVVRLPNTSWKCTCPDFKHRSSKCKHIWAIEFRLTLRREVQAQTRSIVKIEPLVVSDCKWCGSKNIVKDGIR